MNTHKGPEFNRISVFGLLRLLFGYTYDSMGRRNNMLLLVYVFTAISVYVLYRTTNPPPIRYNLVVRCKPQPVKPTSKPSISTPTKAKRLIPLVVKQEESVIKVQTDCKGLQPTFNVPSRQQLPVTLFWVTLLLQVLAYAAYLARDVEMREFMVDGLLAWRGVYRNMAKDPDKEEPVVNDPDH